MYHINLSGFPKKIVIPTVITSLYYFMIHLFIPLLSPYVKQIIKDDFLLSVVFGILPLSMIILTPVIGHISDFIGRKRVIFFGIVCQILAVFFYIIAESLLPIIIAKFLDGIAFTAVGLIGLAKVEDSLENKSRGLFAGFFLSIVYVGVVVGPLAGGYLADRYDVKYVLLVSFTLLLALLLYCMLFYRSKHPKEKIKRRDLLFFKELKQFLGIRELRGMAVLGMVMHASEPAMKVFFPLLIVGKLGLSYKHIGIAFFCLCVFHMAEFVTGWLADRLGRVRVTLAGTIGTGIMLCLIAITESWPVLIVLFILQSFIGSLWNSGAWALMSDIGEKIKKQGSIMGSYLSLAKMGGLISFLLSGLVVKFWGISALLLINGSLIIAVSLVSIVFFVKKE